MPELKPCPFCGGEAKFVVKGNVASHQSAGFSYNIKCSKCDATPFTKRGEAIIYMKEDGNIYETDASKVRKSEMIKAWNRRVDNA